MARMAGIAKATPPAIRQAITPLPATIMAAHRGMFRVAPRLLACSAAVTAEIMIMATTVAPRPVVIGTAAAVATMAALRPAVIGMAAVVAVATMVAPRPVVIGTAVVATMADLHPVGSSIIA